MSERERETRRGRGETETETETETEGKSGDKTERDNKGLFASDNVCNCGRDRERNGANEEI